MDLRTGNYLQLSIERDVECFVSFFGPATQAGVDKLILILNEMRDCFPEPLIALKTPEAGSGDSVRGPGS